MKQKIIFLVGPTAVGKTNISLALAKKINAEIISCDSMQIYKGMDIVTSKPSKALRSKVKHHLIDVITPTQEYNVSKFRKEALKKIEEIIKRKRTPLFVGGTGLYMTILIDGIFKYRPNNKIRAALYKELGKKGKQYLYKRLKKVDPEAAGRIHPNDAKRIVRALEVFKATGKTISFLQKQRKGLRNKYDIEIFCLNMERDILYKRIDQRVEAMFRQGLVAEVKKLFKIKLSKTASCAIGIRELKGYFNGDKELEETKNLIKRNTRLYAKRQLTWFRKDKRIKWINVREKDKTGVVVKRILDGKSAISNDKI